MSSSMRRPLRVLIVEDSEDDAALAMRQLERAGFEVTSHRVENEAALRAALEKSTWDVFISDYTLPSFSGKRALEVLHERNLDLPFIIVSGSLGEDVAVEMMRAGAHDFFAKGNLTRLASAVEREVREAGVRRERANERSRAEDERRHLMGELREAVRARDTFLALAAHELRTPLTSAQLKLDRLRRINEKDIPPRDALEANLAFVARQHRKLAALIDNFMEVSAITSGQRVLVREDVSLNQEVKDALALLHEELTASGSTVSVNAKDDVVGSWQRLRIATVLRNLLSNAMKYGGGKSIEVTIETSDGRARVVVADHGVGIGAEEQARIFNKFEHAIPAHHHGGFGLGLWIVRRVVEEHGGTIDVTSRSGEGSTFTVVLPLDPTRA